MIYATTEPGEALLLGGYTAVLDEGRLLQYGPRPRCSIVRPPSAWRALQRPSHEPVRRAAPAASSCRAGARGAAPAAGAGDITAGLRAGALTCMSSPAIALDSVVKLAEISGSDTFVHAETAAGEVVAQLPACTAARWTSACGCISIRRRPTPSAPTAPCWPPGWLSAPAGGPLMAQIELDLSHSYVPHPQADEDYALLPLKFTFAMAAPTPCPSGCGKTTLLNCVSGLLRPSHGRILFDGQDVTAKTPQAATSPRCSSFPWSTTP